MAPTSRRPKVGLTRMHAALDAMRPMGFCADVVRKCVKNLLKVYGNDGWAFLEDSAYKLLVDTLLEKPEEPQFEYEPEQPPSEGDGIQEQPEAEPVMCDKEVTYEEQVSEVDVHELQDFDKETDISQQTNMKENLDVALTPKPLEAVVAQSRVGVQLGFAQTYTPQVKDTIPTNRKCKPCYGWISDDEDAGDLLQLNSTSSIGN